MCAISVFGQMKQEEEQGEAIASEACADKSILSSEISLFWLLQQKKKKD